MKAMATEARQVPVRQLRLDPKAQMRAETSWLTVQEYAEAMEAGAEFPPVVVFHRAGGPMYVADGWHRALAAKKLKRPTVAAEVRDGGLREAILYAAGANQSHGLRRTNADKRRAIVAFLSDKEWRKWNSAEIARRCNVSAHLVDRVRETLGDDGEYRLQFNGRGGIQYRRAHDPRPNHMKQPEAPPAPGPVCCPRCGHKFAP